MILWFINTIILICFLTIFASAYTMEMQESSFSESCASSTKEIFTKFVQEYFKDKIGIISLQFEEAPTNKTSLNSHLGCLLTTDSDIATVHYRIDANQSLMWDHFNRFNERYGYVLASETYDNLEIVLEKISFMNHDKRIILLAHDSNRNISEILINIWVKYRMLDILAVQIQNELSKSELEVAYYNPFWNNQDGVVYSTQLSKSNYQYETSRILAEMSKRVVNVQGYPLRVCIFELEGLVTSVKDSTSGEIIAYKDMNADTITLLSAASNFTQVYVSTPPGTMFGSKDDNGTSTGQIWVMENELADIAANLILIQDYSLENATFLQSTEDIVYEFMTPRLGYATKFAFLSIFDREVSLFIFLSYILVLAVWIYMKQLKYCLEHNAYMKFKTMDITKTAVMLFGTLILITQTTVKQSHERFLIAGFIGMSMILSYTYQGAMYRLLSTGHESLNIQTLEGLLESELEILIPSSFKPKPYVVLQDNSYDNVLKKGSYISDINESVDRVVLRRDAAFLMDDIVLDAYRHKYYVEETGQDVVHKVAQPFKVGSGGFMVAKRCPFLERLNSVLLRMLAGGLILNKRDAVYWKMDLSHFKRKNYVEDNAKSSFTIVEFQILFKSLAVTLGVCVAVFLIEVLIGRKRH